MKKKFYVRTFTVQVLAEDKRDLPYDIADIGEAITSGPCSGTSDYVDLEVDGREMVKLLEAQGADPEFFNINEDGSDKETE